MDEFPRPVDIFVGFVIFVAGWIYAVVTYGFFLGGGLGWLPAFFLAIIAMFLWRFVLSIAFLAAVCIGGWIYLTK